MKTIGSIYAYGELLNIDELRYADGGVAFSLASKSGEPYGTLSVNVPEVELGPNEFLAKTWSENEPFRAPALASGLFEDTGKRVPVGFVQAEVWRRRTEQH